MRHTEGKTFLAGIIRPNVKMQNIVDGFKSGMESYGFIEGKYLSLYSIMESIILIRAIIIKAGEK